MHATINALVSICGVQMDYQKQMKYLSVQFLKAQASQKFQLISMKFRIGKVHNAPLKTEFIVKNLLAKCTLGNAGCEGCFMLLLFSVFHMFTVS